MKVIFSLPSIPKYRARFEMLKKLAGKVDSLTLLTTEGMPDYGDMPSNMDVRCFSAGKAGFLGGLAASSGFMKADIIHDTFGYLMPLGSAAKTFRSKKYVTSVYGCAAGWLRRAEEIGYENSTEIKAQKKLMRREYLNSKLADFIMANSQDFIRDYTEAHGYPADKMAVVPNSILMDEGAVFENRSGESLNMLFIGRLSKIKGIDLLLEAHSELVSEGHDIRLNVIGKAIAHDRPYIESRKWPNVNFISEKSFGELARFYLEADVCIHPSAQEGMPRVVMEALSYGTPVIASDLAGIRSMDGTGEYIHLMDSFDKDGLKKCILDEIRSPRKNEQFFARSRRHMRTFSPDRTASMIYDNYIKLF